VNAALSATLIRTILESRRALKMAMSMMHELVQTGTVSEWVDESAARARTVSREDAPKLELHHGTGTFALKRKSPRTPLRLVSPFRHDSPLVMPGDSTFADADEPAEKPGRDRAERQRAEEEPRKPTEQGAVR